jgi:hypothetical protein
MATTQKKSSLERPRPLRAPHLRLLTRERRRTPRVQGPFSATWNGAAGPANRVPDVSAHGCYVNALSAPEPGSLVTLTFSLEDGRQLEVRGEVRTIDPGIGFSVQFVDMPSHDLEALAAWIGGRALAG